MKTFLYLYSLLLSAIPGIAKVHHISDDSKLNKQFFTAPKDLFAPYGFCNIFQTSKKLSEFENLLVGNGTISVTPLSIYDNDVADATIGINRKVIIKNTGIGNLSVTSINLSGSNSNQFVLSGLPTFPKTIIQGDSIYFFMAFNPSTIGLKTASININSNDTSKPTISIPLRGLGTAGRGGANEPSLQSILDLLQIQTNVGDDDISTAVINSNTTKQKAPFLGDEISMQRFEKAGAGNVTITPLCVFGPTDSNAIVAMGWYKSGDINSKSELFSVSNTPISNGQTVNVNLSGTTSFDPATDTFGFYSRWPHFNNRHLYSEDSLNTFSGSVPHHVRIYPYKKNGLSIPDSYLVAFEETTSNLDYQDLVFLINNVKGVPSNASLFVENLDKFPSNDLFVFSRVQIPWTRDGITFNSNHDSLKVRIHNNGISPLIIDNLRLSVDTTWQIEKLNSTPYTPGSGLPITINSGSFLDVTLKFTAEDQATRVKVLHDTLIITSNDDKFPLKYVYLNGLWQKSGEGAQEPYAQEIISSFGFKTKTGFAHTDPDLGDSTKLKGDEIKPSFFVRADPNLPVLIRQIGAYHGCCNSTERIAWYAKGSSTLNTVFTHLAKDGQSLLPRKSTTSGASGTITPTSSFGFKVGSSDLTDASKNPGKKIGIRVWRAFNSDGLIIPNTYIISNDYLGTTSTNYDYNDNTYYITNVKPETGTAFYSALATTPSDLDFGERILQTNDSLLLTVKNLGQVYGVGASDPALTISSLEITGENSSEFSADLPLSSTLNPQQTSTIKVRFNPLSQGLKIADLLIHYNNALSPLRVPLYGIAKAADTAVVVNYRIKSGSSNPITVNGKTYIADTPYAFDNLQPFSNSNLSQISATDEDSLYLIEQSSNADKKPFRYEIPLPNGTYVVRLHFAEIYWGELGGGSNGGEGSRVMSVKLENQFNLINFDISETVGGASAVIKNFPVTVTDGKLNIDFSATVNRPSLSAIEVYSFISSGPLSVNDLNLKGVLTGNKIELEWINSNETNTKKYEIQRSINSIDFLTIGTTDAKNLLTYNFTDSTPNSNYNFYRIKQVGFDGSVTFSKIIKIDISKSFAMKLFPNPAKDVINIEFTGVGASQKAKLIIQNTAGSTVKIIPVNLSNKQIGINVSSLSSGIYIIRLKTNNSVMSKTFLKN